MGKFVLFTNASTDFEGESIAINKEVIASVYETISNDSDKKMKTVIYGVNGIHWYVKESYLEVLARLNAD
jgi:hypothetical protein